LTLKKRKCYTYQQIGGDEQLTKRKKEPQLRNRLKIILAEKSHGGEAVEQREIAQATGIAESTISRIANNPDAQISPRVAARLIEFLNVKVDEFYEFIPSEDAQEGQQVAVALAG
jgi:transcriptional regulator with XRE-family HTH domain